ncbi:hypothetical protein ACSNN7_25035 [Micromonospora sp. URMC 105]|uniref:hypothetical protein n=1 Tax=Micromonospora sp. URMC 105 TaxID=3423413 RepID=UPI003F1D0B37
MALLVVAAGGVFVLKWMSAPSTRELPPGPLRDQLAARVVEVLEHDPTFRTEMTQEPGPHPTCVASVFGVEPEWADTVEDVHTVYTWVDCLWLWPADVTAGPANLDFSQLSGLGMPIALHLGPPVTYQAPKDGAENGDSIRRIFPKALEAAAFSPPHRPMRDQLRQRVLQVVASSTPSPSPSRS